ncbi:LuxR C-terminal-related transcriptional regulator [Dactylosporangium siamense]|uniref:LuxR C-terminal-related transcriptional regulator n=1 Tax=Dactylosporangium siamense TaxID=685454 RepID=UPI00194107D6|nr:response regulator transcription factor [Dactylosporangium siamense]
MVHLVSCGHALRVARARTGGQSPVGAAQHGGRRRRGRSGRRLRRADAAARRRDAPRCGDDDYVLEALRGGASGFLLKDTPPRDIIAAVRTVAAGAAILSPAVIRRLIDHVADPLAGPRRARARERLTALTGREREVALALGRGLSNAEIGAELGMSVPTAKGHVSRLLSKLDLNNRVQVALLVHDADLPD